MEETRLKFAKRKLRVQRCKTLPGGKIKITAAPTTSRTAQPPKSKFHPKSSQNTHQPPTIVPKGDPSLGSKISHLSKEERKGVKKSDADRVARRLAKKAAKGKMSLLEKGIKAKVSDKERSRKRASGKDHKQKTDGKVKRRIRSDKAIAKLNTKK